MEEEELFDIINKLKKFDDAKPMKLYVEIYNLLTDHGALQNYSHNKKGVRFKLNNFSKETCDKLNEILDSFQDTTENQVNFVDSLNDSIKPKDTTKRKKKKL